MVYLIDFHCFQRQLLMVPYLIFVFWGVFLCCQERRFNMYVHQQLVALVRFFLLVIFRFPYQLRYGSILSCFAATARACEQILVTFQWAHSHSTLLAFSRMTLFGLYPDWLVTEKDGDPFMVTSPLHTPFKLNSNLAFSISSSLVQLDKCCSLSSSTRLVRRLIISSFGISSLADRSMLSRFPSNSLLSKCHI